MEKPEISKKREVCASSQSVRIARGVFLFFMSMQKSVIVSRGKPVFFKSIWGENERDSSCFRNERDFLIVAWLSLASFWRREMFGEMAPSSNRCFNM